MSDDTQLRGIIGNAAAFQNLGESANAAAISANSLEEEMQRGERQGKRGESLPLFAGALPFVPDLSLPPHKRTKSRKPRQRRAGKTVATHAKTRRKIAGQSRRKNRKR